MYLLPYFLPLQFLNHFLWPKNDQKMTNFGQFLVIFGKFLIGFENFWRFWKFWSRDFPKFSFLSRCRAEMYIKPPDSLLVVLGRPPSRGVPASLDTGNLSLYTGNLSLYTGNLSLYTGNLSLYTGNLSLYTGDPSVLVLVLYVNPTISSPSLV